MAKKEKMSSVDLQSASYKSLYELAKKRGVPGRSAMTKEELQRALKAPGKSPARAEPITRFEAFRLLSEAASKGRLIMKPTLLRGHERRLHVRQTIREDHEVRISSKSEDVEVKFEKLSRSLFAFFRGTALLFYRDMVGEDARMPLVLTLGDVHPKNYGVMPNADNVPIFSVNDFDEAFYAPFTWDLKRGAVGFMIACKEEGGYSRKRCRKVTRRFLQGYIKGIRSFAKNSNEQDHELRVDNAPKLIRKLIRDGQKSREQWLEEDYLDEFKRGFRSGEDLIPISGRRDEFQKLVYRLLKEQNIEPPPRAGKVRVKDVAMRRGQGTASLGLPRYYLLIEGERKDGSDDLIIELKRARHSALAGLVPPTEFKFDTPGDRIAHAQEVQLVRGDVFYGSIEFEGLSFMTRERAPYRDDIDLDDLSASGWKNYAAICGRTLAHAHALSDEIGMFDYDVEPRIVDALGDQDLFVDDILRFAEEALVRLRADHEAYKEDYHKGAFRIVEKGYR